MEQTTPAAKHKFLVCLSFVLPSAGVRLLAVTSWACLWLAVVPLAVCLLLAGRGYQCPSAPVAGAGARSSLELGSFGRLSLVELCR